MKTTLKILTICLLCFACGEEQSKNTTIVVDDSDNFKTISLHKGMNLQVQLGALPATGYTWKVVSQHDMLLEQIDDPEYVHDIRKKKDDPGKMIFTFKALEKGSSTLKMVYQKKLEASSQPARIYNLDFIIE